MHPFLRLYPGMVSAEVCAEVIRTFEGDARKGAGRAGGAQAGVKRSTDLIINGLPEWQGLRAQLDAGVITSLRRYRDEVPNFGLVHQRIRDTGYQIQRYLPGGDGFDWHADSASADSCSRFLAMILYLNTVEAGGHTEFRHQALAIAPCVGSILWFPPGFEYLHRGTAPISGPKYVVTTFLCY